MSMSSEIEAAEQKHDIAIFGGGISGLATALALQSNINSNNNSNEKASCMNIANIHIIEKSDMNSFTSMAKGAGVQITPNGLRALQYIDTSAKDHDLMNRVIQSSCSLEGSAFIMPSPPSDNNDDDENKNYNDKKSSSQPQMAFVPDMTKDEFGLPQVFIRWSLLRHILYSSIIKNNENNNLPKVVLHTNTGKDVIGYKHSHDYDESGKVSFVTESGQDLALFSGDHDDQEEKEELCNKDFSLIIGADGLSSTFRYLVRNDKMIIPQRRKGEHHVREVDVKDTGRINIKAVLPMELGSDKGFKPNHTYAYFVTVGKDRGGIGCFAGDAGDGYTYWSISIADVINDETGEKIQFLSDILKEWDEDSDINDAAEERSLYHQKVKDMLLDKLTNLDCSDDVQFVIDLVTATDPNNVHITRSKEAIEIGPKLTTIDQKCVLVGDAAHSMSGSYGQNPNLALEDAATLVACIRDSAKLPDALDKFSDRRVSRCLEMQKRSAERAAKAMKGEKAEDVSKWIFQWDV